MREHGGLLAGRPGPWQRNRRRARHDPWRPSRRMKAPSLVRSTTGAPGADAARGCRGRTHRVTGLGNASLRGLLGDAALVRAVGERGGGGEVRLRKGVLLAAHVQRAQSMLLLSNQRFHGGPHRCMCAAGGFGAAFGSCLITAVAREIASGTRCISLVLSSRPLRPVTHEIQCVDALAASKQRLT